MTRAFPVPKDVERHWDVNLILFNQSLFSTVTLEDIKRDDDQSHGNNSEDYWVATGKRSVLFSSGLKIGRKSGF